MPRRRAILFALPALLLSTSLSGCAWMRPCVLPPAASPEEVVGFLNENTAKITSWKTDRATISTRGRLGFPLSVGATIAVESPRNFRLIARGPMSNEADIGSNSEHFWFWTRQNNPEKLIVRARHDEDPAKMRRFPFPFQPDWIMESLGVVPINLDEVTMEPGQPGSNTLILIADRISPQGFKIRKVTEVDICQGVVRQHALYDARGELIARAVLKGHIRDARTQAVLPTQINLEWPKAEIGMTMQLSEIEINPPHIPSPMWAIPNNYAGYTVRDLGE